MMKKRLINLTLTLLLLGSCDQKNNEASTPKEFKDPLNNYESSLVNKSIVDHMSKVSSFKVTTNYSYDDSKLYGDNGSRAIIAEKTSKSVYTSVYTNKVIVSDSVETNSSLKLGVRIIEGNETKMMTAVLPNPEEAKTSGLVTAKYGLYTKKFEKKSSSKEFGVSYLLEEGNFADDGDLEFKWNNYVKKISNNIGDNAYKLFRRGNDVQGFYSESDKVTVENPVFPFDATKSVKTVNSRTNYINIEQVADGYQISSSQLISDTDYLSDYFGNPLADSNIKHNDLSCNYEYKPSHFSGSVFSANEYWDLYNKSPVLLINFKDSSQVIRPFENVTSDYQQTYANDEFAFRINFKVTNDGISYSIGTRDKTSVFESSGYDIASASGISLGEGGAFTSANVGSSYDIIFRYNFDLSSAQIKIVDA